MTTVLGNTVPPSANDQVPGHLDITAPLAPYRAITGCLTINIRPEGGFDHSGPYIFQLPKDVTRYTQTAFFKLTGQMKIVTETGENISDDARVCPVDGFGQGWINKASLLNIFFKNQLMILYSYTISH